MPSVLSQIADLDGHFAVWLNHFVARWSLFDLLVKWVLDAHIIKFLPLVLVICWFWFDKSTRQPANRPVVLEAVLTGFGALFIARILAVALPFRDRPVANPDLHLAVPFDAGLRTWSSFPSDHAVMAFALAASLSRLSPAIGIWACFHAAVFICFPRLYFGLHYASDVIAGASIGMALAFATARLRGREVVTDFLLDLERKYPALFYVIGFFALFEISEMFDSVRVVVANAFRVVEHFMA